jgi:hypothetical protein
MASQSDIQWHAQTHANAGVDLSLALPQVQKSHLDSPSSEAPASARSKVTSLDLFELP